MHKLVLKGPTRKFIFERARPFSFNKGHFHLGKPYSLWNLLKGHQGQDQGNRSHGLYVTPGLKLTTYVISIVDKITINLYISLVFKQELVFVYETKSVLSIYIYMFVGHRSIHCFSVLVCTLR